MAGLTSSQIQRVLLVAIVVFGIALRIYFFDPDISPSPDEQTYTRQANALLALSTSGFRDFVHSFVTDPALVTRDPSPTRIGYLAMLSAFMEITGEHSKLAGEQLSLLSSSAALVGVAFLTYRSLSAVANLVGTLLFAVFPFDLTVGRRVWQESSITLIAVLLIYLGVRIANTRGRVRTLSFVLFTVLGLIAATTKENFEIYFLCCAGGLAIHFFLVRDRRAGLVTGACAVCAVAIGLVAQAWLCGGLAEFISLEHLAAQVPKLNTYSLQYESGSAWMFMKALGWVSPVGMIAAAVGAGIITYQTVRTFSVNRWSAWNSFGFKQGLLLITLAMLVLQLGSQRYNFRYTAPIYGAICILGGIGFAGCISQLGKVLDPLGKVAGAMIFGFAVAVAAFRDLNFARDHFLTPGIQDLALHTVLEIPPAPLPPDISY